MFPLLELPREVFLEIFDWCPSSVSVIELWKTGDRRAQHKLEHTVTSIDLADNSKYPTSRWPSCLSRFQRLRRLSLALENGSLHANAHQLQVSLMSLSLELEELAINSDDTFRSSDHLPIDSKAPNFAKLRKLRLKHGIMRKKPSSPFMKFLTRNVTDCGLFSPTSNFRAYFEETLLPPRLEKLNCATFPTPLANQRVAVPPSLTSLASIECYNTDHLLADVPQFQPVELRLPQWDELWTNALPTVTSLDFWAVIRDVSILPRNLTSLEMPTSWLNSQDALLLPRSLTHLYFMGASYWHFDSQPLDLPNLRSLRVALAMQPELIRCLPPFLRTVQFTSAWTRSHPSFPDSVTSIKCMDGISTKLPPSLKILKVHRLYSAKRIIVPPSLTHLDCYGPLLRRDANLIHSNLTTLKLRHFSDALFSYLPRSLTCLKIACLTVCRNKTERQQLRAWSHLPTGLRSLTITDSRPSIILARCLAPLTELRFFECSFGLDLSFGTMLQEGLLAQLRSAAFEVPEFDAAGYSKELPERFEMHQYLLARNTIRLVFKRRY